MPITQVASPQAVLPTALKATNNPAGSGTSTIVNTTAGKKVRVLGVHIGSAGEWVVDFGTATETILHLHLGTQRSVELDFSGYYLTTSINSNPFIFTGTRIGTGSCYFTVLYEILDE